MTTALLQTTYFGPVQWYQKLYRFDHCIIEQYDSYHKQTFRNRCVIATANGTQTLTVPIESPGTQQAEPGSLHPFLLKDLRISDHNQWRRVHWNALQSAYNESPFFDYYADDLRPFFERRYKYLIDFNEAIRQKVCDLLDIHPQVTYSSAFLPPKKATVPDDKKATVPDDSSSGPQATVPGVSTPGPALTDLRDVISAKRPLPDPAFTPRPYWQVFRQKHGFLPNLSILDLLCCMGPEAIYYL